MVDKAAVTGREGGKYEHEMGNLLLAATVFYGYTNIYYYPYFVWVCYSVPLPVRLFCEVGFIGGLGDHILEMSGWLRGEHVEFGNPFESTNLEHSTLRKWLHWVFVAFNAAFAPFGIMLYEYCLARPDISRPELAALALFYASVCLFGVNSSARGGIIGCTRQWHFEHVIVHSCFGFFALTVGGVYDKWDPTVLYIHMLALGSVALFMLMAIVVKDTNNNKAQELLRKVN